MDPGEDPPSEPSSDDSEPDSGEGESDSGEEFPEFEFGGGGGEMMADNPPPAAIDLEPRDADIEMEEVLGNQIGDVFGAFDDKYLQKTLDSICSNLTFQDRKLLRFMGPRVNIVLINNIERFYKHCKGRIKTTFYKMGPEVNSMMAIQLNEAVFQSFTFYRRQEFFKTHWQQTAMKLETLELTDSSFECEGLKFLVDFAPNLRNLSIKNCKLRDLDNIHEKPRKTPVTNVEVPNYLGIISLHFEEITVIEICFMRYLLEKIKPNTLTELSMSKCFLEDNVIDNGGDNRILAAEYFRYFAPLLVDIIMKSTESLTKLNFQENAYQMMIFQKLAEDDEHQMMRHLKPTHLSLALLGPVPEEQNWNGVLQFFRNRCSKLEKLNLHIVGDETTANLQNMIENLTLSNCPLQSFDFKFNGKPQTVAVELGGLFNNLIQLEQLVIGDTKVLDPDVKYIVGGERFYRYRLHGSALTHTPAYSEKLISTSVTNVNPTFMTQLPPNLNQLRLDRFISGGNLILDALQSPICFRSFERLTKLEIRGPYIHTLHMAMPKILTLVNLETLAMTNCDVQDTYITGLGYEAIMDLRRCLTHFATTSSLAGVSAKDIDKIIRSSPNYLFKDQPVSTPRPQLSHLSKLKYLDLSDNPQISDVAVYDSLRLPLVETLILNNCSRITDIGLDLIRMNVPSLKLLSVKYCRKMSEYGINELIKAIPNVKRIHTTRTVTNRTIRGFMYNISPKYNEIVRTTIATESEGFISDNMAN